MQINYFMYILKNILQLKSTNSKIQNYLNPPYIN